MRTSLETISSPELLKRTHRLVERGNAVEAELLAHLGEVDARRLYLEEACGSMYDFCVHVLHFPEAVAYKRIGAARAARRHPELLEAVRRGELHVTAVTLLAPQLTSENSSELIRATAHKTADAIRLLLANRRPKPSVPTSVRPAPGARTAAVAMSPAEAQRGERLSQQNGPTQQPARAEAVAAEPPPTPTHQRARTEPLGAERYCVRFTASAEVHEKLQELRALLRHQIPDGDVGKIIARAIDVLHVQVRKQKFGACSNPKPPKPPGEHPSRSIPASIRRTVSERDGGRCAYVSPSGRRCGSREFLEFHHESPWATDRRHPIEGISLRCRAHNQYEACHDFGERHMARFRRDRTAPDTEPPDCPPRTRPSIAVE